MPIPYRASTYRQPVHQAPPPVPTTAEELKALMLAEMGPRPPRLPDEPMVPVQPRSCRFHPRVWSQGAIHRGAVGSDDGWVLLCGACVAALQAKTLVVLDTCGRYRGAIPAPVGAIHPLSRGGGN